MCVCVCVLTAPGRFHECIFCCESSLFTHTTLSGAACHPPSRRKGDKAKEREGETGRWRDGDEGAACSGCLDVNNAPEGSAENCQLLIFVVSFNHLRLRSAPPTPPFTNTLFYLTPPSPPALPPLAMQRSA